MFNNKHEPINKNRKQLKNKNTVCKLIKLIPSLSVETTKNNISHKIHFLFRQI